MKLCPFVRPSLFLAGCALPLVLFSGLPRAFTTLPPLITAARRDVRVFDNFVDTNLTPDPNWPGTTGAPLALRKAAAEWGSELHGDGSGDPSQPGDLGSGGADFDYLWVGLATSPGAISDNVISRITGCSGGVISFTESGGGGWRMRFYSCWVLFDGPGITVPPGAIDLQGYATHELGHILGLGHSNVAGATMNPTVSGTGVGARSIEADDAAGVQVVYGASSPQKPHVSAVVGSGPFTIVGSGFDPAANEAWFSHAAPTGSTLPVIASGLASSAGGTAIQLPLPAGAGAGDVVIAVPGGGAFRSSGFPFDPAACMAPGIYCVAKVNTLGCTPVIAFSGTPSASAPQPFLITASQVLSSQAGLLIYGFAPDASPFQGGTLCVAPPLMRTAVQATGGSLPVDCSGTLSYDFNARIQSGVDPALVPGAAVFAQYVYRDPQDPTGWGLSDALAFTVCP